MDAQIISIGTELTMGQTVDTNAAWLAQQLAAAGVVCTRHVTVSDDLEPVVSALQQASRDCDVLLVTGGLGPTVDDLTRVGLAHAAEVKLVFRPECLAQIEAYFRQRNREMHAKNRVQAMIPVGFEPLENTCGTAPGMRGRLNRANIFVMPGVPGEMKAMFVRDVLPALGGMAGGAVIFQRVIRTFGMPEAELGEKIVDLMQRGRNPTVGTSAADLIISVRINARAESEGEARRLLDADAEEIKRRLGIAVFGEGDDNLSAAVARMLVDQKKTVATAESCTGGLIAKRLTDVPGSSNYFVQAWVTYSNESKQRQLEVPEAMIREHGAVSAEVAEAMAAHGRRLAGTDYALSATGVAGPGGGSREKPVGLVYVGLADGARTLVKELRFGESLSRDEIRDRTAKAVINMLRLALLHQLR